MPVGESEKSRTRVRLLGRVIGSMAGAWLSKILGDEWVHWLCRVIFEETSCRVREKETRVAGRPEGVVKVG